MAILVSLQPRPLSRRERDVAQRTYYHPVLAAVRPAIHLRGDRGWKRRSEDDTPEGQTTGQDSSTVGPSLLCHSPPIRQEAARAYRD